jgi:hypothetical protein
VADLLQKASAWLEDQRKRHLTQTVVYQRGVPPDNTVEVAATIGSTVFQIEDGAGALLRVESRDYLITAADLVFDDTPITPRRGDRILEGGLIYEVSAPGGEPEWRWSDSYRQTMRIHTKQVDTQ